MTQNPLTAFQHCRRDEVPTGLALLQEPRLNKGTAFSRAEREALGLTGLLPPCVCTMDEQMARVLASVRGKSSDLERYVDMVALQVRNETLFYRMVVDHMDELMPIIYTPTVGEACQKYGHIYQRPKGLFLTPEDRGRMTDVLRNWPCTDVRIIVVTDGERILGLGDQGANGMGIPVGKLSLYTACAGVDPAQCLPVTLDVGTDNAALMAEPFYVGRRRERLRGPDYDALVDEFVQAVQQVYPGALIQFEDFANHNAFRLLHKYKDRVCAFNDDIQGTGSVILAGLYAAPRVWGGSIADQSFLFLGAGEAGIGIADMIVAALMGEGLSEQEARRRCWFVDSRGLVVASRPDLAEHKRPYAHEHAPVPDLAAAVEALRPTTLVGVSGQPQTFTRAVLEAMARYNEHPVILALSNPTSRAECTAEQAYAWTGGRAVFASGSPFDPVSYQGRIIHPGQGNNAYIFPGVGLGVIASRSRLVTDEMFFTAARTLAERVTDEDLALGRIYPPLASIREVSVHIAAAVAEVAYSSALAGRARPQDVLGDVREHVYEPLYRSYI